MSTETNEKVHSTTLYIITVLLSACSIIYEFIVAHTLSTFAANTVVWYSVVVGIFLMAMGTGAILCEKWKAGKDTWNSLFRVEMLLTLVGGTASLLIHLAHYAHLNMRYNEYSEGGVLVFFVISISVGALVGILSGFELPLLIELGKKTETKQGRVNRVRAMDYVGALIGGLLFPLVLLRFFETFTIGFLAALVNLLIAWYILFAHGGTRRLFLRYSLSIVLFVSLIVGFLNLRPLEQFLLKRFYYALEIWLPWDFLPLPADMPYIERVSSPYQKIDLVHDFLGAPSDILREAYTTKFEDQPDFPVEVCLHLNFDNQFCSTYEEVYHEYFAHVPIIATRTVPEEVLIVGGGDGILIKELLKYHQVKKITHVDLDGVFIEWVMNHPAMSYLNQGALENPRVTRKILDGYIYMRTSDDMFDAIYLDLPDPTDYHLSRLYSREFYSAVRRHVKEGGFIAFDAGGVALYDSPDKEFEQEVSEFNTWEIFYSTLRAAGYETIVPFNSYLERDNEKAFEILAGATPIVEPRHKEEFDSLQGEERTKMIERAKKSFVLRHVLGLQQGFIVATPDKRELSRDYLDMGIDTYVLNRKRYETAFLDEEDFPLDGEPNFRLVNSIFRPRLPNRPVTQIRLP